MKVYLAGPMTGIAEYNFPLFREAARALRYAGHSVVSPVEMDEEDGFDPHTQEPLTDVEYSAFLARDLQAVADPKVVAVVVLPGWEESRGARLEVMVARGLGKAVLSYPSLDPVGEVAAPENVAQEALRLVYGDRRGDYGRPVEDFRRSAAIMSTILGVRVAPEKVPLLMIAVKLSRLAANPRKRDSVTDMCGYAVAYEEAMMDLGQPLE